jgi:hypothetical protein
MSTSACFHLTANDGKADRMLMATKLLNQRIKDVMCARRAAGKADITPSLVDLERTHILYVNAHFKPFAAMAMEYNKQRPQAGNAALHTGVTFSIPQFGDFFHDMVCRTRLSQCLATAGTTPLQAAGSTVFPLNGFTPAGAVDATRFYNIVDAFGQVLVAGVAVAAGAFVTYRNFVRYCEYPGLRLHPQVKFDVNGNPLDSYTEMVPVMLEKFTIAPNKRIGHDRLVGQEVPLSGYSKLHAATVVDADAAHTPAGIGRHHAEQSNHTVALFVQPAGGLTAVSAHSDLNAAGTVVDVSRKMLTIVNGPQTPKPVQPPLEIWNKLRFWFCDDVRLSIPSVSIPFGQRFITIENAHQDRLVFEVPSIFLETIVDGGATGVRTKSYTPIFQKNGLSEITIEKMELYINNIFVNPEVHDIYIKRIGFSLIRVFRQHTQRVNADSSDEKQLSQLKWPVEYIFAGLRPSWNIAPTTTTGAFVTGGNQNQWRDWHRLTRMVDATVTDPTYIENGDGAASAMAPTLTSTQHPVMPDQYWLPVPSVNTLSLTAHGIVIFDGFNDTFFNQYVPFQFGGPQVTTPDDVGALFVNMALFPRSYNPSGHLNVSRARETYLKWSTSYISANSPADLFAVAVTINFLLVTDGSAVLRYST